MKGRFPNHCRRCGGTGFIAEPERLHDYFLDNVSNACPDCYERGFCPRCGMELTEFKGVWCCDNCLWDDMDDFDELGYWQGGEYVTLQPDDSKDGGGAVERLRKRRGP